MFVCFSCRRVLPFTVCADNSLFSVYKFLAQNVHLSTVTLASNIPTLVLQSQRQVNHTNICTLSKVLSFSISSPWLYSLVDFERSSSVASRSSQGSRGKEGVPSLNTSITFSDMFHQVNGHFVETYM